MQDWLLKFSERHVTYQTRMGGFSCPFLQRDFYWMTGKTVVENTVTGFGLYELVDCEAQFAWLCCACTSTVCLSSHTICRVTASLWTTEKVTQRLQYAPASGEL